MELQIRKRDYEESVGAVISYAPSEFMVLNSQAGRLKCKTRQFLLMKSPRGDWNFVKGHRENGETDYQTLRREIQEETGIRRFAVLNYLGDVNYTFLKKDTEIEKVVKFYHVGTFNSQIRISQEHVDYAWLGYEEARGLLTFWQSKDILEKISED
ncbi:MAG: NUDIX domain-containing protein [Nitrososphaeraceae archaeon]